MAKINCLIKDTKLINTLKDLVNDIVVRNLENDMPAKISNVYNTIREAGIEVDAESIGYLYNELYSKENISVLSSTSEVEKYVGIEFNNTMKNIANRIINNEVKYKSKQTGFNSPMKSILISTAKMFDKSIYGTMDTETKSIMLQMQDMVMKAVKKHLPKTKQNEVSINTVLMDFFHLSEHEFTKLDGTVNNLETLFDEVQKEVNNYVQELTNKNKLSQNQASDLKQKWDKYLESFKNSTFDIILSSSEGQKLLTEALRQIQISGVDILDSNGNIKWTNLSNSLNIHIVERKVKELFENGFRDKTGVTQQYSSKQADVIAKYFRNLLEEKIIAVRQKQLANTRVSQLSAKNLISDFIASLGYVATRKDNAGQLSKLVSRWDNIITEARKAKSIGKLNDYINDMKKELETYLKGTTNKDGSPISNEKINIALDDFEKLLIQKIAPKTATPNVLRNLVALSSLNNGIAFNASTQHAVSKIAGVSSLQQNVLNRIDELIKLTNDILSNKNTFTAFQYLAQIDRKIKELIHESNLDKAQKGGAVLSHVSDLMAMMKSTLLVNPNNIIENLNTNVATSISSLMTLFSELPIKYWGKSSKKIIKTMIKGMLSHIFGGASEGVISDYDKFSHVSAWERLRFKKNDLRALKDAPIREIMQIPAKIISTILRVSMQSIDVAFLEANNQMQIISSMYKNIGEVYGNDIRNKALERVFNVSKADRQEIIKDINTFKARLKSLGVSPNSFDMKLAYEQALLGRCLTNMMGGMDASMSDEDKYKRGYEQLNNIAKSANEVSRTLLGKKRPMLSWIDLASYIPSTIGAGILSMQQSSRTTTTKLHKKGYHNSAMMFDFATTSLLQNGMTAFIGGRLNFLYLALTASPLGFTSYLSEKYKAKEIKRKYSYDKVSDSKLKPMEVMSGDDFSAYEKHRRLASEYMARAILGTTAMLIYASPYILKALGGDDDDDDKKLLFQDVVDNLYKTKAGVRFINKHFPLSLAVMAHALVNSDDVRHDDWNKLSEFINTHADLLPSISMLQETLENPKISSERKKLAVISFVSNSYNMNISQEEQLSRFIHVLKSASSNDGVMSVERDAEISREAYYNMETLQDYLIGQGAIQQLKRWDDETQARNRFKDN